MLLYWLCICAHPKTSINVNSDKCEELTYIRSHIISPVDWIGLESNGLNAAYGHIVNQISAQHVNRYNLTNVTMVSSMTNRTNKKKMINRNSHFIFFNQKI